MPHVLTLRKLYCILLLSSIFPFLVQAQKVSFKDSLDHKLDLSDWVLTANGFIPIPYLITEPALGGIGGALVPVFIDTNTPYLDSINGELVKTRAKPNLYGAGGALSGNYNGPGGNGVAVGSYFTRKRGNFWRSRQSNTGGGYF